MDLSASENNIHFHFINLISNSITRSPLLRESWYTPVQPPYFRFRHFTVQNVLIFSLSPQTILVKA